MSSHLHHPYRPHKHAACIASELPRRPPSLQHPHNILLQRKQIEDVVRQKQQMMQRQKLMEYEESLRLKQRANEIGHQRPSSCRDYMQKEPTYKYYQQLQSKMQREAKSIKQNEPTGQYSSNPIYAQSQSQKHNQFSRQANTHRSSYQQAVIDDRQQRTSRQMQFDSEIQSQRVIQQYQQQLLDKINAKDKKKQSRKADRHRNSISAKYKLEDVTGGQSIIVNKRSIETKQQQHSHKETIEHKHFSSNRPKIKNNEAFQTINLNQTIKKNAQTIDISQLQQPFLQNKCKTVNCKKTNHKRSKQAKPRNINSERRTQSITTQFHHRLSIPHDKSETNGSHPLKKIQNRLRVSMIVFKDSQLKNNRYQANHLQNTYETEVRLRKDVKDRINNHPKVLEKHNLVVTSR